MAFDPLKAPPGTLVDEEMVAISAIRIVGTRLAERLLAQLHLSPGWMGLEALRLVFELGVVSRSLHVALAKRDLGRLGQLVLLLLGPLPQLAELA